MKSKRISWILTLLSIVVLIGMAILVGQSKKGFFLDEFYSYSCANNIKGKTIAFKSGQEYEDFSKLLADSYTAKEGTILEYSQAWKNASENVHPPLYFSLLHLICSLTPGVFSKWQAIALNIVFAVIALVFFQKILRRFFKNEWLVGALSLGYVLTLGLYANIIFLRMYVLAMAGLTIVTWEMLRFLQGERGWKSLVRIALASAFSVLSHYYCLLYLFFICAVLCVILFCEKSWKSVLKIALTEVCAGGICIAVFPAMITKLLFSHRGVEAQENLTSQSTTVFVERLQYFFNEISTKSFAGILLVLLIAILVLIVVSSVLKKGVVKPAERNPGTYFDIAWRDVLFLVLPVVFYFFLVVKIAAYEETRYIYPIFTTAEAAFLVLLAKAGQNLLPKKALFILLAGICIAVSAYTWKSGTISYLYLEQATNYANWLTDYQGTEAVVMWGGYKGKLNVFYPQADYYSNVTPYYKPDLDDLAKVKENYIDTGKSFMLVLDGVYKDEKYHDQLLEMSDGYSFEKIFGDNTTTFRAYYFHPVTEEDIAANTTGDKP